MLIDQTWAIWPALPEVRAGERVPGNFSLYCGKQTLPEEKSDRGLAFGQATRSVRQLVFSENVPQFKNLWCYQVL